MQWMSYANEALQSYRDKLRDEQHREQELRRSIQSMLQPGTRSQPSRMSFSEEARSTSSSFFQYTPPFAPMFAQRERGVMSTQATPPDGSIRRLRNGYLA